VPLTVFRAGYGTRYLVIEMGATKPGNITYLAEMVRPDIGVVLGVGTAHVGEFGGVDAIARTKGELFAALGPGGTAVINADDERVLPMRERTGARRVYFTSSGDFAATDGEILTAANSTTTPDGHPAFDLVLPDGTTHPVVSPLLGLHHTTNLLAAASVAWALSVPGGRIAEALRTQSAASRWRMERTDRADGVTVINDAYNANPESMRAALRTLAELGGGRRRTWAVLGEMLELGESSIEEHDLLGRVVVRLNISKLVVVGDNVRALYNGALLEGSWGDEIQHVPDAAAAEALLRAELAPGDIVLFKSSNGAGLRFLGDRIALLPDAAGSPDPAPPRPADQPAPAATSPGENSQRRSPQP
jgi:UDP-N-acetylmuramoyl-tripeptide--D-alanyl-D-alanine ligase